MESPNRNFLRPTWAEISLSKLRWNYERVRALAQHGVSQRDGNGLVSSPSNSRRVMAVIKADAYGHGAVPVAQCLASCGVDWFGVATIEEALELRQAGIEQPMLLLGGLYMSDPAHLVTYNLTPCVSSTARLDTYAECARRHGKPIEFHLNVDTGLGRLGMPPDRVASFVEHYSELRGLIMKGVMTHFASAEDMLSSQTDEQMQRFQTALAKLRSFKIEPEWVHASNSAALVTRRFLSENLVRVGALLYGYCLPLTLPADRDQALLPELQPILTFKSRVVFLKDVPSGTPLGYGASYYARRPTRIATVPVGYADGLSRGLSNRGRAIVRDRCAKIVGQISMDLTLLDVTDIPGVDIGDEVILIGKSEHCSITALEIARELGTVPYEVLCSIGKRVPRIYVD